MSGASRRQIAGICPLKRARATSSSSLLIPTSPAKAWNEGERLSASPGQVKPGRCRPVAVFLLTRCSSANDFAILTISLLKRSSSCKSTTVVGEMSSPKPFRIWSRSNTCGILFAISLATFAIYSSRLIPVPVSPETKMV